MKESTRQMPASTKDPILILHSSARSLIDRDGGSMSSGDFPSPFNVSSCSKLQRRDMGMEDGREGPSERRLSGVEMIVP
jgi:hypothetical protein